MGMRNNGAVDFRAVSLCHCLGVRIVGLICLGAVNLAATAAAFASSLTTSVDPTCLVMVSVLI